MRHPVVMHESTNIVVNYNHIFRHFLLSKTCYVFRLFEKAIIRHRHKFFMPVPDEDCLFVHCITLF
jgi:hypothetical protein